MVLRLPDSWSNENLEMFVFEEREKPEYQDKNLSEQRREPTTTICSHCSEKRLPLSHTSDCATTEQAVKPSLTSVQVQDLKDWRMPTTPHVMLHRISLLILDYARVVLTSEFVDEILKCDNLNKSCIFRQHHLVMLFITPSWIFPSCGWNYTNWLTDCLDH